MKVTKQKLKQIIKEEINSLHEEGARIPDDPTEKLRWAIKELTRYASSPIPEEAVGRKLPIGGILSHLHMVLRIMELGHAQTEPDMPAGRV